MRVLRVDRLTLGEGDFVRVDLHALRFAADEMHLDAAALLVVKRAMRELLQIEISAELAIDALQQIEIERRSNAECIVVRRLEDRFRFAKIGTQKERIVRIESSAQIAEHRDRF